MNSSKKPIFFIIIILFVCEHLSSQVIDSYSLSIGFGLANQYWNYEKFPGLSERKSNKIGYTGRITAEKRLNDLFTLRPSIGYIQKGYTQDIIIIYELLVDEYKTKNKVILHNLSLDIAIKVHPLKAKLKPYLFLGFRIDYLMGYKDYVIEADGNKMEGHNDIINDFNKFTVGGLIGAGINCHDLVFIDVEFNPAITNNLNNENVIIKDQYLGITAGLNIKNLIKKNNE